MGEKTLRIGTGVDDLIVSRAGHIAFRLNPSAEVNIVEEEQNMWRRIKKRKEDEISAGCRTQECLVAVVAASETPLCC